MVICKTICPIGRKRGGVYSPPISLRIVANPSTARWLVNIRPPYLRPGPGFRAPDWKSCFTVVRFGVWKLCSRTGMKVGL